MLCAFTLFHPLFKCYFFLPWKDGINVRFGLIQSIFLRTLFNPAQKD